MRLLEIILLFVALLLPFLGVIKRLGISRIILLSLITLIFILHAALDGLRWQMIPIYLVVLILIICLVKQFEYFKGNVFRKLLSGVFLFLMIGGGFLLSKILPVFTLPIPQGIYKVGAQDIYFTTNEDEYITSDSGDKRALMIKVWYPTDAKMGRQEPYLNNAERIGFAKKYGLPQNTFNYLSKVETHTFIKADVAKGSFPLLIFSHGHYSNATGYYTLLEEIVSQGYIVLNINHTYESVGSLFPSGEIKFYDLAYDRKHNNEEMGELVWNAMEAFKKATSKETKRTAVATLLKSYVAADINERWAKDIILVVDQIPEWASSSFLSSHIDTSKIGVFGHSQGGAAAGQALLDNSKIKAGINIDGVQWGEMIDTFMSKPFLLLSSDWPEEHPNLNEIAYQNASTTDFYLGKIKNSGHSNFMDIPFMIDLPLVNEAGEINKEKAVLITANVVTGFFNKYLQNEEIELLELARVYPDLELIKLEERDN